MRRFSDIRVQKMLWPWNPGQRSLKVIESGNILQIAYDFLLVFYTTSCRSTVSLLLELQLSVKFGYFFISCLFKDDVAYAIDFICTCWLLLIS